MILMLFAFILVISSWIFVVFIYGIWVLCIPAYQHNSRLNRYRNKKLEPNVIQAIKLQVCSDAFRNHDAVMLWSRPCMGNLLSLGAKMCIWNLTEGRSRNCDFKCKLGTYFCGFGLYSCNAILHAMCFQFCLHRDIHKKCIPILI